MKSNLRFLIAVPEGEEVKSMVVHKGIVFVATDRRIYRVLEDDAGNYRLAPVPFDNEY